MGHVRDHRYYYCRNHDILRAGGEHLRCPERNIRADDLDAYVFAQVRRALVEPGQLIAGERALITSTRPATTSSSAPSSPALERKLEQAGDRARHARGPGPSGPGSEGRVRAAPAAPAPAPSPTARPPPGPGGGLLGGWGLHVGTSGDFNLAVDMSAAEVAAALQEAS